jgi:hypothetical protein
MTKIIMHKIIERPSDLEAFRKSGPWVLVCGRRKTGKTFFVKQFLDWDEYFFVKRGGYSLLDEEGRELSYPTFLEIFRREFPEKCFVVDEFQRLPQDFFDFLHQMGIKGRLIAITSALSFSKKMLDSSSPLLGLFSILSLGLIDERDILLGLSKELKGKELVEAAVYLREPWLIPRFEGKTVEFLSSLLYEQRGAIKALIGEIFTEEERELSLVYQGILEAVAMGKRVSTEISSHLYSLGLLPKDNPGVIQRYLDVLVETNLLEKIPVYGSKKFVYKHVSPLLDLHFYLEGKHSYTETEVPEQFVLQVVQQKLPLHVEEFFFSLFSKLFGLRKMIIEEPPLDIALFEFKRLKMVGEVKWGKVEKEELLKIAERLRKFDAERYIVIPEGGIELEGVKVLDVRGILEILKSALTRPTF